MTAIRVLVVEDVEEMREFLADLLAREKGIQVSGKAGNVWEARMEVGRRRPDVVLLDEILPGESSVDLLRELVADGLPVVLMTGVENPTHAVAPEARSRVSKPEWRSGPEATQRLVAALWAAIQG